MSSAWCWDVRVQCSKMFAGKVVQLLRPRSCKKNSWATQLSMKYFRLINVKMPMIVGILTFMSRKNSTLGLSEPEKGASLDILNTYEHSFKTQA